MNRPVSATVADSLQLAETSLSLARQIRVALAEMAAPERLWRS